jgi:uncharacterized protein (TIGR01777 family)
MKIMLLGGTGFIGKRLKTLLNERGHEVLIRDLRRDKSLGSDLESCEGVVNLAGASIFGKRWNPQYKEKIYNSRIFSTRKLVELMGESQKHTPQKPTVFVNASAIGFYGNSLHSNFDEDSEAGPNFLSFVCKEWEAEAHKAALQHKIRTVIVRFGIVLGKNGGALEQLLPPFKAFVGGPVGNGQHWSSWVHIDDACGIIIHALENGSVNGILNAVSPNVVNNKTFSNLLGQSLSRPSLLPVPKIALYLLLGEAAGIVANGQRVFPKRTIESGYEFKFLKLSEAFKNILKNN